MGNSVTAVKIHIGDGVSYYKPPVRVAEILTDYPDYIAVSLSGGKRIILSSDVNLQPGCTYHLVSSDSLFSAESGCQTPSDKTSSCCSRGHGKLYYVVAIYMSAKSLLVMLIAKRNRLKIKSFVTIWNFRSAGQPRYKRTDKVEDNSGAGANVTGSLQALDARTLSVLSEWSRSQNELIEVSTASVGYSESNSPQALTLGHGIVTRVGERSLSRTPSSPFTANSGAELEKVRFSCIPWKTSKTLEPEYGRTVSQTACSKEKWLQDMIRGADNMWKRNKPVKGVESNEVQPHFEKKFWGPCLPTGGPLQNNELYLDYSECQTTPGSSPGRMSFDFTPANHDPQLFIQDQEKGAQVGMSARSQLEIVESKQSLESDDERDVGYSQHPLWLKMDAMEREFERRLSSSSSPPTAKNSLQMYPGKDASARSRSLHFSPVERG